MKFWSSKAAAELAYKLTGQRQAYRRPPCESGDYFSEVYYFPPLPERSAAAVKAWRTIRKNKRAEAKA